MPGASPPSGEPHLEEVDGRGRFILAVTLLRWATVAIGVAGVVSGPSTGNDDLLAGGALLAYTVYRTGRPIRRVTLSIPSQVALLLDLALPLGVVVTTGHWDSPYAFTLSVPILIAGFYAGPRTALAVAALTVIAVAVPYHLLRGPAANSRFTLLWSVELLLLGVVGSYARRLAAHAGDRSRFAKRFHQLSEANALLLQLHTVAQRLPESMDLDETIATTVERLRHLFSPDVVAVLLRERTSSSWTVAAVLGVELPASIRHAGLPGPLAEAASAQGGALSLEKAGGSSGLSPSSSVGLYAPLRARNETIGLVAVERRDAEPFDPADVSLLEGFAAQAALAIDNARWFARLRTISVEEERSRIARDLHDRLGQSLAYIGLELDRIKKAAERGPVHEELDVLRTEVGGVVRELRDTLFDLRSDVSEERDLASVLRAFLDRVAQRSAIKVDLRGHVTRRLDLVVERELWRIAQEAVRNAERHSRGSSITVTWQCDDDGALLEVLDDGRGMSGEANLTSFGIVGMRERADAVGATLDIAPGPAGGTALRVRLVGR